MSRGEVLSLTGAVVILRVKKEDAQKLAVDDTLYLVEPVDELLGLLSTAAVKGVTSAPEEA